MSGSLLAVPATAAAGGAASDSAALTVHYRAAFSADDLVFDEQMGYDVPRLADTDYLNEPGWPLLPAATVHIALPPGMQVTGVRVAETHSRELAGEYTLVPAQPFRRLSDGTPAEFVPPDAEVYASTEAYPGVLVEFIRQTDLAGQGIAIVEVYPLQYVPAEKQLTLYSDIEVVLEGTPGYRCGDYLPARVSASARDYYERVLTDLVVNPEALALQTDSGTQPRGVAPGDYDYVIITQTSWVDDFQPLADWKTQKGIPATTVDLSWIYSEYSGSTNQDNINSFVQDAHSTWGAMYFLLGGDTNVVPDQTKYYHLYLSGVWEDINAPSDSYYGDYDQDFTCEVHVGRACVRDTAAVSTFVSKVLTYEQSPPLSNYARKAALFGFDVDSSSHGEDCKTYIDSTYIPSGWTITDVYDSDGTNHETEVRQAINAGQNLINHIDHADYDWMGTGSYNHGWGLSTSEVDAFYNGDRQNILYSTGCFAAAFDYVACIAEHFVQNPDGGSVAFIGNSRFGIYQSFNFCATLSNQYDREFFEAVFTEGHYVLGEAFSDHKNEGPTGDSYERCIFDELNLLGDPALRLWTADPASLDVAHDESAETGVYTSFPVNVSSGGSPVYQATVCLWKNGDVYEIEQTNSSGTATFWFAPGTIGTLYITITKQNYLPYQGTAYVFNTGTTYNLTVDIVGQGDVERDPPGPTYYSGTWVELTADPDPGWHFQQWVGALSGSANPEILVMNGNKTVTAIFAVTNDCNENGLPDEEDISSGYSDDYDLSGVPDECEDCDENGVADACDLDCATGNCASDPLGCGGSPDCNENDVPDECDITDGTSEDCQPNGVPDECDLASGSSDDYDLNSVPDECEDCNGNGVPDACDVDCATGNCATHPLGCGGSPDCNESGSPDECDVLDGTSEDCQPNGIPDECDLDNAEAADACANAESVCTEQTYYGTTVGATNDGSASCGSVSCPDVWYYYKPFGSGFATISLCGSSYDTVLSLHTGCPGTPANEVDCDDDHCGSQSQLSSVLVTSGTDYWIRVSGKETVDVGDFQLAITVGPACSFPAGDENGNGVPDECERPCLTAGDSNCDGLVNTFDIDAFVLALTSGQAAWQAAYTCDFLCANDCNDDEVVNTFDIDAFVAILTGK